MKAGKPETRPVRTTWLDNEWDSSPETTGERAVAPDDEAPPPAASRPSSNVPPPVANAPPSAASLLSSPSIPRVAPIDPPLEPPHDPSAAASLRRSSIPHVPRAPRLPHGTGFSKSPGQKHKGFARRHWVVLVLVPAAFGAAWAASRGWKARHAADVSSRPRAAAMAMFARGSVEDRAARGDVEALGQIRDVAETQRTTAQVMALALGHEAARERELSFLRDRLVGPDSSSRSPDSIERRDLEALMALCDEPHLAAECLAVVLELPATVGPDVLYRIWTRTRSRTKTTALAQQLLYTPSVRERASPGLRVALDLRAAQTCADRFNVLPRAAQYADARSIKLLERLEAEYGCGAKGAEDCHPCLRDGSELRLAIEASAKRPDPLEPVP